MTVKSPSFSYDRDCIICGLRLYLKKLVRWVKTDVVRNALSVMCNNAVTDAMQRRVSGIDLTAVGARYHLTCYLKMCKLVPEISSINCDESVACDSGESSSVNAINNSPYCTLNLAAICASRSHADHLQYIADVNNLSLMNTAGGGNCFF